MSALEFLLLEANLPDAEVVQATLREGGIDCELLRVDTRAAFIRALESNAIDLILADYALSSFDEIAALTIARRLRPEIPFIFISGSLGEELAVEAIKQGATDYVLKQRLGRLVPSVQRALQEAPELDKDTIDRKRAEDERKQVESALRESEAFRRLAVESGRIGTWRWDCRSRQCWGDAGFLSLWGVPPSDEKLPVSVFTSRLSPEGAAALEAVMTKDIAPGEEFDGQLEIVAGANAGRWIRWRGQAEREAPWIINGVSFDVTEQKRTEVTLRESQARLQSIANLVPDLLWDSEPDGSTNWYNQRWMEYTGQTFEQAIGWGWTDAIHPNDQEGSARHYREAVEQGMPLLQEHRIRRHDGAYRWFVVKASPLKDESGKVIKMYGAATDIHEQRVALEALRESEAKYRSLFNAMDEGYMLSEVIFDENDKPIDILYLEANPAAIRLAGRDFSGQRMREIDPNYEEYWYEIYGRIALTGEAVRAERYAEPHGRWFDFYAFKVGERESRRIATVFQDITDRKRQEEALRESEERLRDVLNSMAEGFALLGGDFTILDVNEETLRLDGRSRDELIDRSHWDAFPGTEDSPVGEIFRRVARERVPASLEHMYRWPDGRSLWLDMRAYPTQNDGVAIFWRDVTDRKQAEAALRQSEEKYRSLFNSMDEAYAVVEVMTGENGEWNDFLFLEVNPAFVKQTGMEYPVGRKATELLGTPNPQWAQVYGRVAETGEPIRFEEGEATLGRVFDLYVFRLGGEGSRRVAVLFTDITDRKLAEAQLRRAAEVDAFRVKLADALRSLSDPVQIQAQACRFLGEQVGVDRAFYVEIYEAEGYARVNQHYSRGDSPSIVGEYPLAEYGWSMQLMRRGETIVVADTQSSNLVPDAERAAMATIGMVGFVALPMIKGEILVGALTLNEPTPREWTEAEVDLVRETAERIWADIQRAHAETALRQSEEKYRSLFTSIDEGFNLLEMISDESGHPSDFRIVETNPVWEQQTGLTDAVGKTLLEIVPNFEQQLLDFYIDVSISGRGRRTEYYTAAVDRWYTVFASRIGGEGSRQVAVVFNDISDHKRRERQQEFLINFSDYLRMLADEKTIEENSLRLLAEFLRLDRAYIFVLYVSEDRAVVRAENRKNNLASMLGEVRMSDFPETVRQIEEQTLVVNDIDSDATLSDLNRTSLAAVNLQAFVCANVRRGERNVVWSLAASTAVPRTWTKDEVELIETVAERIWAAVERAKAEKALRESELQRVREQSAREQERQRAESLAELDRAKTLFFSNVSHEFRTPLTLSLAPLQDALSDSANPLPQTQQERLELAHRNSLRLLKLVNTLLDFSRIEADRLKANYEPTDLSTYTAELASVFRSAIENANLQLVVDCPPLPDPIYVDREMWEKIVLNLLSNALKFTFEGMISVSLKPKANTVELMVSDTGVGISASELPHLFERFYQVKGAKGRSYEGSGIGLSLVQELVKRHGGAIAVTSAVDQGTTFTVTIPTGIAHLPADQIWVTSTLVSSAVTANAFVEEALHWLPEEEEGGRGQGAGGTALDESSEVQAQSSEVQAQSSEVQAQSSEVHAQSSEVHAQSSEVHAPSQSSPLPPAPCSPASFDAQSSKRARILLVDDNADMRGYLKRLLIQYYEVETVNDGLAALTAIRSGGSTIYDLVLADVMMPRMNGLELLRSLRANPNTRTIPIILLSARAGEESRVEGLETGADDYLIKPFSARELLARVNANLQLAQLRREAVYREQVMQAVQTLNERLEQQVKARTAQLEAINQELEAFSSSVSHDLRTPLRYISSFAERLQGKLNPTLVDASSLQTLNIIIQSALQAEKMVDDLLEFSRLGKTEMHLTTVNISQLAQQVQAQLQPELSGRSLHWQIEPLATVKGDPALLRLVLQNLLSNAVKYTRNNTEAVIKIGSIEQEQEVIFFVKDNGAGFDMKYHDQLFSMFQRLHPQEEFAGTGVGLATVRRIVHRHGGRIWAEGAIDEGATFYFSLPKHEA